jgi:chitinase
MSDHRPESATSNKRTWEKHLARAGAMLIVILCLAPIASRRATAEPPVPVVAGYVFPDNSVLQPGQIDSHSLNRINYAFANIVNGRMVAGFPADAQNIPLLTALRRENPSLKVLISVGGWLWSTHFSDVALTEKSRRVFIQSSMDFVDRYDLDGLDVDWEYPGQPGAGHPFRSADKHNFTLLLKELRARFDQKSLKTHRRLYLTIAAGADDDYLAHTEMAKVEHYVDDVNLMTYDYYEAGSDPLTGNHASLFADPADPRKVSDDETVRSFEKAGVPAAKILLGLPFYGKEWGHVRDVNHGLFQPGLPVPGANASYNAITSTMLNHGFTRYWDSSSSVPYLYSPEKQIFVSYEDPESIAVKCNYVLTHKLGGVMFWSYLSDSSGELLHTINQSLHKTTDGLKNK